MGADEIERWRRRAIAWSDEHPPPLGAPPGTRTPRGEAEHKEWLQWSRDLHAAGLAVAHWPEEWGGASCSREEALAIEHTLTEAGTPLPLTDIGINLVGPALIEYGSEELKSIHLPAIADGSAVWTQLFSEPEAGSDLASLRTRARRDEDGGWTISGQKVWSTYAHLADWGFLLARSGTIESRHRGITAFAVPMDAPGIEVRPIPEISGHADFNEVFLDGLVLPAEAVIGEPEGGWAVAMSLLAEERRVVGRLVSWLAVEIGRVTGAVESLPDADRDRWLGDLGRLAAEAAALEILGVSAEPPGGSESLVKISFSEIHVELHQLALDLAAAHPGTVAPHLLERWSDTYLNTRCYTISGGANEVLRNVVAKRTLGLV